jgi:hypothetical protein
MKRLLKIALWFGLILFIAPTVAFLSFWKFFPEKKIIALVENRSSAAGTPVKIGSVAWSLPARIEIRGIQVWNNAWQTAQSTPFFTLERLWIKCRILPILRRRLEIAEVEISGPKAALDSSFFKMRAKPAEAKPAEAKPAPVQIQPLPLSLRLLSLKLGRFRLRFDLPSAQGRMEAVLDGLKLEASGVRLPRKWAESPRAVRGAVRLFTERALLRIRFSGTELTLVPELDAEFKWQKGGQWSLKNRTGISPIGREQSRLSFLLSIQGQGYGDSVLIRESVLSLAGENLVRFSGGLSRSAGSLRVHVNAEGGRVDLKTLKQAVENYMPDSTAKKLSLLKLEGLWNPLTGEISGSPSHWQFRFGSQMEQARVSTPAPVLSLKNGFVSLSTFGTYGKDGLENGAITGKALIGQLKADINDTLSFSIGNISSEIRADLDKGFLPLSGRGSVLVKNMFGGRGAASFQWALEGGKTPDLSGLRLDSELRMDSLDVTLFPNAPKGLHGLIHGSVSMVTNGLRNIRAAAAIRTGGIGYLFEGKPDTTPPLAIRADAYFRMPKPLENLFLDSLLVRSEDFLFIRGFGSVNLPRADVRLSIRPAMLINDPLVRFFPDALLKESLKGLKLSGREKLTVDLRAWGRGRNAQAAIDGRLTAENAGLAVPEQAIGVEGVDGEIRFLGDLRRIGGSGAFSVRSVFLNQLRTDPIEDSRLGFRAAIHIPDSMAVDQGFFEIPSLFTKGRFAFGFGPPSKTPIMTLSFDAAMKSLDSLQIVRGVSVLGEARCQVELHSLDWPHKQFRLSGMVQSDSLSIFQGSAVEVKNITSRIPFKLHFDAGTARLLRDVPRPLMTWTSYETDRERLRQSKNGLENIRIEKVMVQGYSVGHIVLDMAVQDGLIDVPYFSANLLGGDVGGSMWIDAQTGRPQDITYAIRAQASRINSAQLGGIETRTGQETELDASLWFTGRGVDMNKPNWEGSFHITQIGSGFAGTLLKQMDPQGSDRSIRLTRRLLDAGWKPKLFSFELRHGYVYPSLKLAQPWFFPLRIPDKVEYGRLPLEFFLKQKNMFQSRLRGDGSPLSRDNADSPQPAAASD